MKKFKQWLCKFSGEDFVIINEYENKNQNQYTENRFALIGLFVLIVLLSCFISAFLFSDNLFHTTIQDIGIAIIWGFIVTNLYVLLLYTISPTLLPKKKNIRNKNISDVENPFINLSFIIRILLLILLAIIVAQPFNVLIFDSKTTTYLTSIRKILNSNKTSWFITIIVTIIFLMPVYWKYSIRKVGKFYELKADIEKNIIVQDYNQFKQRFKHLLETQISTFNKKTWENLTPFLNKLEIVNKEKYESHYNSIAEELKSELVEKYEYWADPPFRTIKKDQINISLTEEDFLNHIYNS